MEIFFVSAKAKAPLALAGAFQLCVPVANQRLLLAAGAFVSPEEPWQRRTRARLLEKLLQDASPSMKGVAELWAQLLKKLPELSQSAMALALLLEDGSLELRAAGLGSLLIKSEARQKILALQQETLSLSSEVMAGATELVFFEEDVDRAEEIAALLQDAEQTLGEAAVRRLLVPAPSEPVAAPPAKEAANTPREIAVPQAPQALREGWRQYAPWGVAAVMSLLWLTSFWTAPGDTPKSAVIDTKAKFIPQETEEPVVDAKKPEKKTPEPSTSLPKVTTPVTPASTPTAPEEPTPPTNKEEDKPTAAAKPVTKPAVKPKATGKTTKKTH